MIETIKEYLVSLGFSVDKKSFDDTTKAIDGVGKGVQKFAGTALRDFATAGLAVSSFVASSMIGIAKFMDHLGNSAIENEKFARQMWISEQAAQSLSASLKATGATLNDLYLSPTLAKQFMALRAETAQLTPPADYKQQINLIQSIQFEFKRMKLEATYAMQWIGYYLTKNLSAALGGTKLSLKDLNDWIVKNMPVWTKKVADVLTMFVRFGDTAVHAGKDVLHIFQKLTEDIPTNIKAIGVAVAALGAVAMTGPIGIFAAAIIGLILLLDDFYTYTRGGKSMFGPFWQKLIDIAKPIKDGFAEAKKAVSDFFSDLDKNGTIDSWKQSWANRFEIVKQLFDGANGWVQDLWSELEKQGVLTDLKTNFEKVIKAVSDLDVSVTGLIKKMLGLDGTKSTLTDIGKVLNEVIIVALETVSGLMEGIAGYIEFISKALGGGLLKSTEQAGKDAAGRLDAQPDVKKQGVFSGMMQDISDLLSKWRSPNFSDKVTRALGLLSQALSPDGKNGATSFGSPAPPSYIYPQYNTQNNHSTSNADNSSNVTLNQTNNIYGSSDPNKTAEAVNRNTSKMFPTRSFRSATQ